MVHARRKLGLSRILGCLVALVAIGAFCSASDSAEAAKKKPSPSACKVGALTPKFDRKTRQASMGYHVIRCGGLTMQDRGWVWLVGERKGRNNDIILKPGKMAFWPVMGDGRHYIPAINCDWNKNGLDAIYTRVEWTNRAGRTYTKRSKTIRVNCSPKPNLKPYPKSR